MRNAAGVEKEVSQARGQLRVCLLQKEAGAAALLAAELERMGFPATATTQLEDILKQVGEQRCCVLVSDLLLNTMDGLRVLEKILAHDPDMKVVLLGPQASSESALAEPSKECAGAAAGQTPLPLEEVRRLHIHRVLEMCGGNRVRAADLLGIGRTSLYRFLKRERRRS